MTTLLVWTGVALWLALNAIVTLRMVTTQPSLARVRSARGPYRT